MNNWIMDYETIVDCFVAVFEDYKTDEIHEFSVGHLENQFEDLVNFLTINVQVKEWHISFNGLSFDSQITQFILNKRQSLSKLSGPEIANEIYKFVQEKIIRVQDRGGFPFFAPWNIQINQIDLFRLHHWERKHCSLKWAEYSMDWDNVEEMPIHHSVSITTWEQLNMVKSYCRNDVAATKNIFKLSRKPIELRRALTKEYGIDLYSASEPRISKELFAHFYCQKTGIDKKEFKKLRTYRDFIKVEDIMLPYIKFNVPEFKKVEQWYKDLLIDYKTPMSDDERKKRYKLNVSYKGVSTDYGLGGIHGVRPGIYEAGNGMIIITSDVTSFYPNLAIRNGWAPAHMDRDVFCPLYEWFFDERKLIPKSDPRNYVYKIILNATYGLSKDENSFFYDPLFTMKVTINGQLLLTMLYEQLIERIPGAVPIMQNTDGVEIMIPKQYYDQYMSICKEWEELTKLGLEHDEYEKIIVPDVNNYIAVVKERKAKTKEDWEAMKADKKSYVFRQEGDEYFYKATKCKGRFEWEDQDKKVAEILHKNKSFLVVPKAVFEYFVNGVKPEDYIATNKNIFDYCGAVKENKGCYFEARGVTNHDVTVEKLQKVVRYYNSNSGKKLIKVLNGRDFQIEAGKWLQTVANKIDRNKPFEEYDINFEYYIQAIYREIEKMDRKISRTATQLTIF